MVSRDDLVYFRVDDRSYIFKNGFKSKKEIENRIDQELGTGKYDYGKLENIDVIGAERNSEGKKFTEREKIRIENLTANSKVDDRIEDLFFLQSKDRKIQCSIHQHTVRYKSIQIDFKLRISEKLFNSIPVSNIDEKVENKIKDVFHSVCDNVATFLGYDSSYSKRGQKDPYVVAYGRIHREEQTDKVVRRLEESDFVKGCYRTSQNISPVPIYEFNNSDAYLDQDYILVLDIIADGSGFEDIPEDKLNEAFELTNRVGDNSSTIDIEWIGKVPFEREYHNLGIGISL